MPKPTPKQTKGKQQGPEKTPGLFSDLGFAMQRRCPACRKGKLFSSFLTITKTCPECGASLGDHDIGDGASVFLIFLLGFLLMPLAWLIDLKFTPPIWLHLIYIGGLGALAVFFLMPAVKAYILLLEYRHRPAQKRSGKKSSKK